MNYQQLIKIRHSQVFWFGLVWFSLVWFSLVDLILYVYCHTRAQLGIQLCLDLAGSNLQVGPRSGWFMRLIFFPPAPAAARTHPPGATFKNPTLRYPRDLKFCIHQQLTRIKQSQVFWFGLVQFGMVCFGLGAILKNLTFT